MTKIENDHFLQAKNQPPKVGNILLDTLFNVKVMYSWGNTGRVHLTQPCLGYPLATGKLRCGKK